jgi:hypothetical protein
VTDDLDASKMSIDPAEFEEMLRDRAAAKPKSRRSKKEGKGWQRFYTTVPRAWELRLQRARSASTYRLALELLYLWWRGKGKSAVIVSGAVAKAAGLSARSKSRALAELGRLDLARVIREPRKSPRVTLKHANLPKNQGPGLS